MAFHVMRVDDYTWLPVPIGLVVGAALIGLGWILDRPSRTC